MATYNGHQEDVNGNLLLPTPHSLADNVELGGVASEAYTVNTFLVFDNRLCKVTRPIAKGNAFSIGYNLEVTTAGAQLSYFHTNLHRLQKYGTSTSASIYHNIVVDSSSIKHFSMLVVNWHSAFIITVDVNSLATTLSTTGYTVNYLFGGDNAGRLVVDGAIAENNRNDARIKIRQANNDRGAYNAILLSYQDFISATGDTN